MQLEDKLTQKPESREENVIQYADPEIEFMQVCMYKVIHNIEAKCNIETMQMRFDGIVGENLIY